MNQLPIIIDFEGIDYSFKETNAKLLETYFNSLGIKSKMYSFPQYGEKSAYFVEKYLNGDYTIDHNAAPYLFMLDMMDTFQTKIVEDMKNGLEVLILDRYWYSNVYYSYNDRLPSSLGSTDSEIRSISAMMDIYEPLLKLAKGFCLPNADLIISMGPFLSSDPRDYYQTMNTRQKKDIYEKDMNFMVETFNHFKTFNRFMKTYMKTILVEEVNISNEEIPRQKENIFGDILHIVEKYNIEKVVRSCRVLNIQPHQSLQKMEL